MVLVEALPVVLRREIGLTSNPAPSFSGPPFGSDLKPRACETVPDALEARRRFTEGPARFVSGMGSPGARPGPG